jgi:GNAT superfamily N-acetyltransferase
LSTIAFEDCTPVRLTATTEIKPFDCGDSDLNDFLSRDAPDFLSQLLAVTYLFEHSGKTVAFFCVSNDKIQSDAFPSKSAWRRFLDALPHAKRWMDMPAVKIGRLGVHADCHGTGLGSALLDYVKVQFTDGNKTGCRFITVDAYNNPRTLGFYARNGFMFLSPNDADLKTRLMYFDLKRFADAATTPTSSSV